MLNITNDDGGDIYSFMAGGLFDYLYAGGGGYSQSFAPSPNLEAFFISQGFPTILSMLDLNEDFIEFALLPMQILIYKQYEGDIAEDIQKAIDDAIDVAKSIKDKSRGRSGYDAYEKTEKSGLSSKKFSDEFLKELLEERRKGVLKSALQSWAFNKFGPAGAILAGWAYDGKISGATVADVVTGTLMHKATEILTEALAKGLKISSGWASLGIGIAVEAFVREAFEVAIGLDRSFGFGGELVGVDDIYGAYYEESYGVLEGIKNIFSKRDITRHVDINGEIVGFEDMRGTYRYKNYPTVSNVLTGKVKFGALEYEKRMSKKEAEAKRERDILNGFWDRSERMLKREESPGARTLNTGKSLIDKYYEGLREEIKRELGKTDNMGGLEGLAKKGGMIGGGAKAGLIGGSVVKESISKDRGKEREKSAKDRTATEHSRAQRGRSHRSRQSRK